MSTLLVDSDLGKVLAPAALFRAVSYPGRGVRRPAPGEIGIFVAVHKRPRYSNDGLVVGYDVLMASVTHNERVDAGAAEQAIQVFAGGSTPATPSATIYPHVIAIANGTLTKGHGDQSLGSASSGVTTNEFTASGLTRVACTAPGGGDYTAPASLGAVFTQNIKKTFTATGSVTAYGAGLFDSVTVAASVLYVEDNFASTAVLVNADTMAVTIAISN